MPDVRFFFLSILTYVSKTRIQRCLSREVDGIWQYRTGGNLTIFDKDHDAVEEGRSQTEAFATIAIYSWWQLGEIECVPNLKSAEGGGEAGHAHGCIIVLLPLIKGLGRRALVISILLYKVPAYLP